MKFNHRILLISFALLIQFIAYSWAKGADPFPNVTLPVHPKAINPESRIDSPAQGAKATVYTINMAFPAKDLTAFYDIELKKMGYVRFTEDGGGTFQWENFNPKTGEWKKTSTVPARYTAVWVDPKRSIRIWLYMAYKYDSMNKDWKEKPLVSINMAKFFDLRDIRSSETTQHK